MDKRLRQLKLFLDFYFAPWGAAKGQVWEDCFECSFNSNNAADISCTIIEDGLTEEVEELLKIMAG